MALKAPMAVLLLLHTVQQPLLAMVDKVAPEAVAAAAPKKRPLQMARMAVPVAAVVAAAEQLALMVKQAEMAEMAVLENQDNREWSRLRGYRRARI